jgi:PIN domain nuclease of toxin-antitoxin system
MIYLDTHVLVWLFANDQKQFTPAGLYNIEHESLLVSPMVRLELHYLHEIKKISVAPSEILDFLMRTLGLRECTLPFGDVVAESVHLRWTRDPFDRLIVAQSLVGAGKLLTKDRNLLAHAPNAFW